MKSIFVSITTLAFCAFAAPSVPSIAEESLAAPDADVAQPEFAVFKRAQTTEDLISAIKKATNNVNTVGATINVTLSKVKSGAMTKQAGSQQTKNELQKVLNEFSSLVAQILAAFHVAVPKELLKLVVDAVDGFVQAVVLIVGAVINTIGFGGIPLSFFTIGLNLFTSLFTGLVGIFGREIAAGLLLVTKNLIGGLNGQMSTILGPILNFDAGILSQLVPRQ
ncbi:hypothetical protein V2A60_007868 [Cordyceps javanica]|uniref:Uncharacterized protein n=1 Tax=Cordyceps javanica TaxID=43265 RepID=A0A545W6I9_9HYPO|nr:hypothetical protein IF1G_02468 [Cordyceps javanica]TQW09603.1 hypothetical protein IF2G_02393 [Cordyceps javanica]